MTTLSVLNISDDLYVQIQRLASAQNRSVNDEVVRLLQQALQTEALRQAQFRLIDEIRQTRWTSLQPVPDSVLLLRESRGYDE